MKKFLIGVSLIIGLSIFFFILYTDKEDTHVFKTEKIVRGDIKETVMAAGTVNAVTMVLVGTQISGTVKEIHVNFNSPVRKGQLIARIDPAPFEAKTEQAKASLLKAEANLKRAEARLLDTQRKMNRKRKLFAKNFIAKSEMDITETNHETAMAQVGIAEAEIAYAKAVLKHAETNLKYTYIFSPIHGVVVSRNVDMGQTVAASFRTPTLFTIAQDLTKMQIDTNVHEADIGKVEVGQSVEFTVDAYEDITFTGKVSQVRIAPIEVQNVITYDVVIGVDNPDLKLKPGMTANVSIITAFKQNVLKILNMAFRFQPARTDNPFQYETPGLWIVNDGKPKRIPVEIGISDGIFTELISDKINEGEDVIIESLTTSQKKSIINKLPNLF